LLNSGELEREYDEIIRKQRDGSADGDLRSSLCALIFLIGKLPRTPGADDGVRADAETLVDLLVCDLKSDRPRLEQQVPRQLKQLVETGQLMAVETEFRLQTREGAVWTHEFNRRRTAVLNDDPRINAKRSELLRDGLKQALKPVSLKQGHSGTPRKLAFELSSSRPGASADEVSLWLRDGWSDDEKSVLNDARAAGVASAMLFGYLPRLHHEELKQAVASFLAAQETLDAHGMTGGPETIEPRKAVETHLAVAQHRIQDLLGHIVGGAKVYLGGGQEANGIELADKVQDSADSALVRLFPQFAEADHANWGQVVIRSKAGDVGALAQVGYAGNPTQHPVCRRVLDVVGAGKKAKDLRDHFKAAPFGWPQDAIDGALLVMLVAGNLRATLNGQPVQASVAQNQMGPVSFYVDVPPLDVQQRLNLKALFQKTGVTTQNGKESDAAAESLKKLLALAESAGGDAPRPATPETHDLRALQMLSGNAQLLKIHEQKDDLAARLAAWKKRSDAITQRWPAWQRLLDFHAFAAGLAEAETAALSIAAISAGRTLLADPDPVPELTRQLSAALRIALGRLQDELTDAFSAGNAKLAASPVWNGRSDEQRATIAAACQLAPPPKAAIGTEDDILGALRARSLADRSNLLDAVPQRFARALEEANRLATPEAVRVTLPGAVINNPAELDLWLAVVREQVEAQLQDGPVIL
jgi:hypothetical protein